MRIQIENKDMKAAIDTRGAELKSFSGGGLEYIWQSDPAYWAGSSPVLFPIVCDVRGNRVRIENEWFDMKRHGFASAMEFEAVRISERSARFLLGDNTATHKAYPYRFELSVIYELRCDGMFITFNIQNMGDKKMYFALGLHTGFRCPLQKGSVFEDYDLVFETTENLTTPLLNGQTRLIEKDTPNFRMEGVDRISLEYSLFGRDALVFDTLRSRKVSLINRKDGKGISVGFPGFSMLGIWTPAGKRSPFVCIEPWNGTATYTDEGDDLSQKRGVQSLLPQEQSQFHIYYKPIR